MPPAVDHLVMMSIRDKNMAKTWAKTMAKTFYSFNPALKHRLECCLKLQQNRGELGLKTAEASLTHEKLLTSLQRFVTKAADCI